MSGVPTAHPRINKLFSRSNTGSARDRPTSIIGDTVSIPTATASAPPRNKLMSTKQARRPSNIERGPFNISSQKNSQESEKDNDVESPFEPPVIVEPPSPQSQLSLHPNRRIADRPFSVMYSQDHGPGVSPPGTRLSDLPSRLSGWFSQSFNLSTTDLSLPGEQQSSMSTSPRPVEQLSPSKPKSSGILRRGGLEKAFRYILDSDASMDRCAEPIWLMGVMYSGYEETGNNNYNQPLISAHRRDSTESSLAQRRSTSSTISRGIAYHLNPSLQSLPPTSSNAPPVLSTQKNINPWPPGFYEDFSSCLWMTYRSHFPPLRDTTLASLDSDHLDAPLSPPKQKWWPLGGEKTWTSDTGWGCMLRTGQSLLASALFRVHLSRDWRKPQIPSQTTEYATYVKILTWFMDSPAPSCPFGIHRMALAGKDLGKDVGSWFGPSTAAGAIKTLVHAFPDAQLAVSVAVDSIVYESDVYEASHRGRSGHPRRDRWGGSPVLVLAGIRLGIDGVNPIYYNGLRAVFTWPQSVGISGGRPSSSYYFVGEQAGSLFYLDPHFTRPAIPVRPLPGGSMGTAGSPTKINTLSRTSYDSQGQSKDAIERSSSKWSTGSLNTSRERNTRSGSPALPAQDPHPTYSSPISTEPQSLLSSRSFTYGSLSSASSDGDQKSDLINQYSAAYSMTELRTFHCEKVRKMPFAALDPSMLLGFLCKDEHDWKDLRDRLMELSRHHKPIFTISDEPPSWSSDAEELESFSDSESESNLPQKSDQISEGSEPPFGETRPLSPIDDQKSWNTENLSMDSGNDQPSMDDDHQFTPPSVSSQPITETEGEPTVSPQIRS